MLKERYMLMYVHVSWQGWRNKSKSVTRGTAVMTFLTTRSQLVSRWLVLFDRHVVNSLAGFDDVTS